MIFENIVSDSTRKRNYITVKQNVQAQEDL